MGIDELKKEFESNRNEIRKVSHMIDNLNEQLKTLLDKDTDLYYKLLKLGSASIYGELAQRISDYERLSDEND